MRERVSRGPGSRASSRHQRQGQDLKQLALLAWAAVPPLPSVRANPGALSLEGSGWQNRQRPSGECICRQEAPEASSRGEVGEVPSAVLSSTWSTPLAVSSLRLGCGLRRSGLCRKWEWHMWYVVRCECLSLTWWENRLNHVSANLPPALPVYRWSRI